MIGDSLDHVPGPSIIQSTCFSGGSKGADQLFGELATKAGHKVFHWSFLNHYSPCPQKDVYILSAFDLSRADSRLKLANKVLNRSFPTRNEYVNNLLRRNWHQVENVNKVFATTPFDENMIPTGGTAWTLIMALQNRPLAVLYNFDPNKGKWYTYKRGEMGYLDHWEEISLYDMPYPSGLYAGIGSSELSEVARKAIISLYDRETI